VIFFPPMDTSKVIEDFKKEIKRLQSVVDLLEQEGSSKRKGKGKGTRKPMSAESRKKIGDAQRKRWAKAKAKG
jgi:hypothetical protein